MRTMFPQQGAQTAIDRVVNTIWREWLYHQDILDSPALLHDRLAELQSRQASYRRRTLRDFLPSTVRIEELHSDVPHLPTATTISTTSSVSSPLGGTLQGTSSSDSPTTPTTTTITTTTSTTTSSEGLEASSSTTNQLPLLLNRCPQCHRGR